MNNVTKVMNGNLNINLMIDHKQAEEIFNALSDENEVITQGWDSPKKTVRFGKDVRCERIEIPFHAGAVYMCYLLNIGIDNSGAIQKIA